MQRLIIISRSLISHWHIAFLNVSTVSSLRTSLLPPPAAERQKALAAPCTQLWWWQCFSPERVAPPPGNSSSGITDRWPGYCCLWYLLVNFCNQYNISQQSPWEWKPETAHLILEPAPAPCSAAKLGSWPTWCGIIAAEVRCELSRTVPDEWLFLIKRFSHPTRDI